MIKKISWDDLYVRSYVTFNESRGDPLLGMFTQMDPPDFGGFNISEG
jgi:hypothetical protein